MAAPAILAKGSHEGMLILNGANRVLETLADVVNAEIVLAKVEVVGVVGIVLSI